MNKFSLIIPVFNENDNLELLFMDTVKSGVYEIVEEIIFVDDCSTDGSNSILRKLSTKNEKVNLITHTINMGQSNALNTGIKSAVSENIITIDSDGQNPPSEIIKMINKYNEYKNPTLLAGIRTKRKDNLIKILSSILANKFRNLILGDNCPDTGCSLKIFKKKDFIDLPFFDGIHRFLPALFIFNNVNVKYMNVAHKERLYGISKYGTVDRLIKTIGDLFIVLKIKKSLKNT